MGIATPNSKDEVNGGVSSPLKFDQTLLKVSSGAGLNQVRGINNTNSTGNGIPAQVTNISTSLANASTGNTSNLTITFRRDPSDVTYAGVTVWATGYQGSTAKTQLAAGVDSPINVVLSNTGESVSIQVQAYGNGGAAPLSSAPTAGVRLPLGASGFGPSTNTGGAMAIVSPGCWLTGSGCDYLVLSSPSSPGQFSISGSAFTPKIWLVRFPFTMTVKSMNLRMNSLSPAASLSAFAVYSSVAPYTKLFAWDSIDTSNTSPGGGRIFTLPAPYTMGPGFYYYASAASVTSVFGTEGLYTTTGSSDSSRPWNTNGVIRTGSAANPMSAGGVMPATLGVLSSSTAFSNCPLIALNP